MSQNEMILQHLKKYGEITSMDAISLYGCTRLSARIHELRKMGFVIDSLDDCSLNRYGRPVHYSRYVIKADQRDGASISD